MSIEAKETRNWKIAYKETHLSMLRRSYNITQTLFYAVARNSNMKDKSMLIKGYSVTITLGYDVII